MTGNHITRAKYLDHVEAVDPSTVKFVFKQKPNVGVWQYGALQGPIVQKAFWEPIVKDAAKLLPADTLRTGIDEARASLATAQSDFANVSAQVITLKENGQQNLALDSDFTRKQNQAIYAQNNLNKLLEDYAAQIKSAQETFVYSG